MTSTSHLNVSPEVAHALAGGHGVVALESTLLAHGLPAGRNLEVGLRLERVVREAGAIPATIAVLDGVARIGLDRAQLERVCDPGAGLAKLSRRDLGATIALGRCGATTISATSALAHAAGIGVFGTGGLGGVHLPLPGEQVSWDVSADLGTLAALPTLVVCSGVKSVLDIAATLEVLETHSVPVLGYRTEHFPGFYRRSTGLPVSQRVDDPAEVAAAVRAHRRHAGSGLLLANPVPAEYELDRALHDRLLAEGMAKLRAGGVRGSDVTPVLLEHFHRASAGASLDANEALVLANARLAAEVAVELSPR
ncbi:pseudouridine-5'-phosphate glycosidase [Amycolatopsis aidingensis]|uniref:pseudouridine-5'-phosphate glycosidase n=1 Tax=Amycolatopsis aidingensis TaxID=2842453 RepID=UPI001C0D7879|nr:pseudouridine-5'-phosphate glycosidase [Amycolatopsis aidingensis]